MDLRVARRSCVAADHKGKRKILAAEIGAATRCRVGDRAGFEEPVQLHIRPAAEFDVGYQPALLWDVNRQDAQRRDRWYDCWRSRSALIRGMGCRDRSAGYGANTRYIVHWHAINGRNHGYVARGCAGSSHDRRHTDRLVIVSLADHTLH